MIEKIKNLYLSKKLFIISSILCLSCYAIDAIQACVNGNESDYAWVLFGLVALLLWAFLSGHINVQKMLFGSILLAMLKEQIELLKLDIVILGKVSIMDVCLIIIAIITFISHMYQQMEHTGRSLAALINQLLGLTMALFLMTAIINVLYAPSEFGNYVFLFGYVFNCIMVICMETRVEKYKQIRDKARKEGTWTEEHRTQAKKLFKL